MIMGSIKALAQASCAPRLDLEVAYIVDMLIKCFSELGANSNTFRSNFQRDASKLHTGLRAWSWLCRQCCRSLLEKQVCSWGKDTMCISMHTLHSPICRRNCWCACNPTPTVCSATVVSMRCVWGSSVLLLHSVPECRLHEAGWKPFTERLTVCTICRLGLLLCPVS